MEVDSLQFSSLQSDYRKETDAPFEDGLTGLFNHGFFQVALDREIKRSERTGKPFTLAFFGIDSFGIYNKPLLFQYMSCHDCYQLIYYRYN